ncbi:MAG: ABC transporter permease [Bacteroidetes bacterium]|jgi:ABC-2 type transport system permease protein|nr:ABC transporter permease [Bacteroidota bacterium]MBT6686620.1 ABC transporter permease [Bacteroidota bacterium]MBT7143823.1 ABC transporter permease [Bacteroidota bacterium]MBT7491708.1 ABC transporter permease [Bacteroidota bacterium]
MKRFFGFIKKEFFHIFRDKRTMLILFGMPIIQILLFGYVVTNEIKDAEIAILDLSKDDISQEITNKLSSSGYFQIKKVLHSHTEIEDVLKSGIIKEVVVFEADFAKKIEREGIANIQLIADASDANTANLIVNYTKGIISNYAISLRKDVEMPLQIEPEIRMFYNEELKGAFMFVPGTMALILMLISAMMTSISIAREKELGTMEVLLVSPLRPFQIIIGKVSPYIAMAFVNAVVIIAMGVFVFNMPVLGSISLLMLESLLFIVMALALGIFISTVSNSQQVAMFISLFALLLPTMLLSGFIFPIENMPLVLQWLSSIIPPKYFIIIIKNVMLKGTGISFVWKETLVLLGMTVFFILLSVKKFKVRLE